MKYILFIFVLVVSIHSTSKNFLGTSLQTSPHDSISNIMHNKEFCFKGKINKSIPVFIHYQLQDDVLVGEIIYLNTKKRNPIILIGTKESDSTYRILEFQKNGDITGIIYTNIYLAQEGGDWFSPKTKKTFKMQLTKIDSAFKSTSIMPNLDSIYGNYHYQYGANGYLGDLDIEKLKNNQAAFSIISLTEDPSRNIADLETTTIKINKNSFSYKISNTDSCAIKVTFYKGFVHVKYTQNDCFGYFGHNATVAGIFLKQ